MFTSAEVWVLFLMLGNGPVEAGSYSTKEACIYATSRIVIAQDGKESQLGAPGICVPVEKTSHAD